MRTNLILCAVSVALSGCASESGGSSAIWTSADAIEAFEAANLEASGPRPMTADDYGAAPMRAKEGTRFIIPSLCEDCGGRALSFETAGDQAALRDYYEGLGRQSALLFSWVFEHDNLLVQINGDLPEPRAKEYEAALSTLK